MNIKVLGTGCSNCKTLEKLVRSTVEEMKIDATVEKVEDIQQIMGYGIMRTPGLVINEKVVLSGKIPSAKELVELIEKSR
jgi:small redox-active disulfide protein 2